MNNHLSLVSKMLEKTKGTPYGEKWRRLHELINKDSLSVEKINLLDETLKRIKTKLLQFKKEDEVEKIIEKITENGNENGENNVVDCKLEKDIKVTETETSVERLTLPKKKKKKEKAKKLNDFKKVRFKIMSPRRGESRIPPMRIKLSEINRLKKKKQERKENKKIRENLSTSKPVDDKECQSNNLPNLIQKQDVHSEVAVNNVENITLKAETSFENTDARLTEKYNLKGLNVSLERLNNENIQANKTGKSINSELNTSTRSITRSASSPQKNSPQKNSPQKNSPQKNSPPKNSPPILRKSQRIRGNNESLNDTSINNSIAEPESPVTKNNSIITESSSITTESSSTPKENSILKQILTPTSSSSSPSLSIEKKDERILFKRPRPRESLSENSNITIKEEDNDRSKIKCLKPNFQGFICPSKPTTSVKSVARKRTSNNNFRIPSVESVSTTPNTKLQTTITSVKSINNTPWKKINEDVYEIIDLDNDGSKIVVPNFKSSPSRRASVDVFAPMTVIPCELKTNSNKNSNDLLSPMRTLEIIRPWLKNINQHQKQARICEEMLSNNYCLTALMKCMGSTCSFYTNSKKIFLEHLKIHEKFQICDEKNYIQCSYCNIMPENINSLVEHIVDVHGANKYQCTYCFYRSYDHHIFTHIKMIHPSKADHVIECKPHNILKTSTELNQVWNNFQSVCRPMICVVCKAKFYNINHFTTHMKSYKTVPISRCLKCKNEVNIHTIIAHVKICHNFGKLNCGFCTFGSDSLDAIKIHLANNHENKLMLFFDRSLNGLNNLDLDQNLGSMSKDDLSKLLTLKQLTVVRKLNKNARFLTYADQRALDNGANYDKIKFELIKNSKI